VAGDARVLAEAANRCERYLADRRAIDANLADAVVSLAARVGDASLHRRLAAAAAAARTPQEQRRFLLALGAFRSPELVAKSLALALTEAVASQDVAFLLLRLLANPAARETTWEFVRRRWPRLRRRLPPLLTGRLIEATWQLATPAHRREVADFFARHPVPAGERALRQALERFDWYRGFRTGAARQLSAWLAPREAAKPPGRR
jgi:aminopeptidase N